MSLGGVALCRAKPVYNRSGSGKAMGVLAGMRHDGDLLRIKIRRDVDIIFRGKANAH